MARLLLILAICVGIFQSVRSFEREGKGALEMRTTKYGIPYKIDFEDEELRRLKKSFCRSIEDLRFYDTERNVAFEDGDSEKQHTTPFNLLLSYQGSGNHWVRQLIEQGAGLMTGTLYPGDFAHWRNIGINLDNATVTRSIRKGHTVIVKSHSPLGIKGLMLLNSNIGATFKNLVILVRNPLKTARSSYNMRSSLNLNSTFEDWDTKIRQDDFESYVKSRFASSWHSFFTGWLEELALRARVAKLENVFYGYQADFWNAVIREEQTIDGFSFGKPLTERKEEALKIPEGFQFPQKVMLVRFEDLAKDTIGKMSEIFNALEVSTDYWSTESLQCAINNSVVMKRTHDTTVEDSLWDGQYRMLVESMTSSGGIRFFPVFGYEI